MHHNDFVVTLDPLMKGALKGRKWRMSFKQFQEKINFFLSIIFKKKNNLSHFVIQMEYTKAEKYFKIQRKVHDTL